MMIELEDVRRYYRAVVEWGEPASSWSNRAGVAGTTITRLVDRPESAFVPKPATLRKIIEAAPYGAPRPSHELLQYAGIPRKVTGASYSTVEGIVVLPKFDLAIPKGPGSLRSSKPASLESVGLSAAWVRQATGSKPESIALVRIADDNMAPTLTPGDWVFADLSKRTISSGRIHILKLGNQLAVHRVFGDGKPKSTFVSSDSQPEQSRVEAGAKLSIVGRVCGIAARKL